jgi:hypothetical protein
MPLKRLRRHQSIATLPAGIRLQHHSRIEQQNVVRIIRSADLILAGVRPVCLAVIQLACNATRAGLHKHDLDAEPKPALVDSECDIC